MTVYCSIFEEIQCAYELPALKLIKAAVTCWLSHGKAAKRVLDCYETLVASLDSIYIRKHEPAVLGLRDKLIQPKMIAVLCLLTDILHCTNKLQTFLQGARLNFLQIPSEVEKLLSLLQKKIEELFHPPGCYLSKFEEFIEISGRSAGARSFS